MEKLYSKYVGHSIAEYNKIISNLDSSESYEQFITCKAMCELYSNRSNKRLKELTSQGNIFHKWFDRKYKKEIKSFVEITQGLMNDLSERVNSMDEEFDKMKIDQDKLNERKRSLLIEMEAMHQVKKEHRPRIVVTGFQINNNNDGKSN